MSHTLLYKIKVLTNLHAGSGDSGFGIVDKLVQRDAATQLPTIYASGIKGALREYFKPLTEPDWLAQVFGAEVDETGKGTKPGAFRFLAADILCIPVARDSSPYFSLVYDPDHVTQLEDKYKLFEPLFRVDSLLTNPISNPVEFKEACNELPVIARNHLENGQSINLWYEEVVPHQSEFISAILCDVDDYTKEFKDILDNAIIQIGGNATVGYGLCRFLPIQ